MVKRSAGDSAVAAAAYQSRSDIFNEYRQQTERYARKRAKEDDVVHLEIMLPDHAPKAYADRGVLWNSVEQIEDQRNAQLARRIILTLPNEVPRDEWEEMVRQYCREQFVSKGMCADVAIHYTEPPPNPHAHILLTLRSIDERGKWCPKFRKVPCDDGHGNPVLDENGKPKINQMSKALGVSTKTGYKLLRDGKITAIKIGRTYRISKLHLLTYLKVMDAEPTGKAS